MAAEAGPDAVGALLELGRFAQALPLAEQMVAAAPECVRLAPGLALGHRLLCRVAAASGEWKAAEGHGRSAVELDPGDGASWAALATAFRGRGRLVAALRCFSAAGRLGAPGDEVRQAMVGTLFTLTLVIVVGVAAPAYALSAWIDG